MRVGFVLPSCNYNIVLSEDDLKQLLDNGYVSMRPERTKGKFIDVHGSPGLDTPGHYLRYEDEHGEQPVQYVGISLDRSRTKHSI